MENLEIFDNNQKKYCIYCGEEIPEGAKYCNKCGKPIYSDDNVEHDSNKEKTNGFAIAGFVIALVSLFIDLLGINSILAIVLSSIGLGKTKDEREKGKKLAIAGLILAIFEFITRVTKLYEFLEIL